MSGHRDPRPVRGVESGLSEVDREAGEEAGPAIVRDPPARRPGADRVVGDRDRIERERAVAEAERALEELECGHVAQRRSALGAGDGDRAKGRPCLVRRQPAEVAVGADPVLKVAPMLEEVRGHAVVVDRAIHHEDALADQNREVLDDREGCRSLGDRAGHERHRGRSGRRGRQRTAMRTARVHRGWASRRRAHGDAPREPRWRRPGQPRPRSPSARPRGGAEVAAAESTESIGGRRRRDRRAALHQAVRPTRTSACLPEKVRARSSSTLGHDTPEGSEGGVEARLGRSVGNTERRRDLADRQVERRSEAPGLSDDQH